MRAQRRHRQNSPPAIQSRHAQRRTHPAYPSAGRQYGRQPLAPQPARRAATRAPRPGHGRTGCVARSTRQRKTVPAPSHRECAVRLPTMPSRSHPASPATITTTTTPRISRLAALRPLRFSLPSRNPINRPKTTTGCGTARNSQRISATTRSRIRAMANTTSGSAERAMVSGIEIIRQL